MNSSRAENFIRSAKAPAIRAGVMIAKVIWNIMKTYSGTVPARLLAESILIPPSRNWPKPPMNLLSPASGLAAKASE